ncbi:hypothetical protein [Streptomyces sp. NPDC057686]|uniref:hypothetical protein n=1 Tax=Streptomyces sp. NPDC057686 TaxID=3346212 RepID=UPI00369B8753
MCRTRAGVVEGLFATDLAHLQNFHRRINDLEGDSSVACLSCGTTFAVPGRVPGGLLGTA